ncbi:MAG TPA: glycosyltransferase [Verrucomicrobiota bacterium]|nr:glycosyltransferase [Verrucomicrobiota bacterium]HNS70294.1 glycosyltransferase [Verrucomicrobiota bacterium]
MTVAASASPRVSVEGKFFRLGPERFFVRGLAYGPFALPFAAPEQTRRDFAQIRDLGANLIRVYHVPPRWLLDLAAAHELKVLVDIPWNQHLCFLDSAARRAEAMDAVRRAVSGCARHPAVFAFSVASELAPDIVRWSGPRAVSAFLERLMREAKRIDPDCLCTFTSYPPTEALRPAAADFVCFNLYLHREKPFRDYLARLQIHADAKPLLLGEFGIDALREGEARQAEILAWQIESAFRGGLAGAVIFTFTDDWWRGGRLIEDWKMGLTTRDRQPRPAAAGVRRQFRAAPYFPLHRSPRVSVVVASYNGARTLRACLASLARLNYPDYEVILVDDGSTDDTPQIAAAHPQVRCFRHERNLGLSTARNTGIAAATGAIVAFTDADCRADPDWLYYLVGSLLAGGFAGMGGPNLLPPEDSPVAAAVMASPGGPTQVMLTDRQAEHIPGCNMAFYKWALDQIGGFDPTFRQAGDDVDLCWRLQQAGLRLGFSPAAVVWHYRRATVGAYLRQQLGYGEAEALLVRKHPECFNSFGGSLWRGRIYTSASPGSLLQPPIIYRGLFASAGFQFLYAAEPAVNLLICTTPEYHVLVTLPLWVLSAIFHPLLPLALASLLLSLGVCLAAGARARIPAPRQRWWSRPLVSLLFGLQPIMRGWARYRGRLMQPPAPAAARPTLDSAALRHSEQSLREVHYWAERRIDRLAWAAAIVRRLDQQGWPNKPDVGWSDYDVEVYDARWSKLQLVTVAEEYPRGKQLIRCRLRPRGAPRARIALGALGMAALFLCGLIGPKMPWIWLLLLALPLFGGFLRREQRKLQSLIMAFLDDLAREWNLVKIPLPNGSPASGSPAKPPPLHSPGAAAPTPFSPPVNDNTAGPATPRPTTPASIPPRDPA